MPLLYDLLHEYESGRVLHGEVQKNKQFEAITRKAAKWNMNETFKLHVEQLHRKYEALIQMEPVTLATLSRNVPRSGVYLFSEGVSHLYVGRSKRLRHRLRYHCGSAKDAPFAFKLAREQSGKPKGTRATLLTDERFIATFQAAKDRIRKMQIRFIEEPDPNRQALLEIYITICVSAPYNDFDTH